MAGIARKLSQLPRRGFTLVELMIVVVIVAILALASTPLYRGQAKTGKMSEGIQGVGVIREAMRVYASGHEGEYPVLNNVDADGLSVMYIAATELNGKYFMASNYLINSSTDAYTMRATLPEDSNCWYQIDQDGGETRSGF